jgi:hypothetical protein
MAMFGNGKQKSGNDWKERGDAENGVSGYSSSEYEMVMMVVSAPPDSA